MKRVLIALAILFSQNINAQFVAKMEQKAPIKGLCHQNEVYALLPMKGQEKAMPSQTAEQIQELLNTQVVFLKDSSSYVDKGMVNIIINCKGEVVQCEIDNKTKHPELDQQIVAVFASLGKWKPGKLNGKEVDTSRLWSFEIKDGKFVVR